MRSIVGLFSFFLFTVSAFAQGAVASVSPAATDVGVQTLKAGGNAVDAAIAVGFAEAVTWPEAGNIGGGGFMLIHPGAGKKPVVIDYRETAPAKAEKEMFAKGVASFFCGFMPMSTVLFVAIVRC